MIPRVSDVILSVILFLKAFGYMKNQQVGICVTYQFGKYTAALIICGLLFAWDHPGIYTAVE